MKEWLRRRAAREGERERSRDEKDEAARERTGGLLLVSPLRLSVASSSSSAPALPVSSSVSLSVVPQSSSLTRAARSPTGKTFHFVFVEKKEKTSEFFFSSFSLTLF